MIDTFQYKIRIRFNGFYLTNSDHDSYSHFVVPICDSKPSSVRDLGHAMIPALFIRASRGFPSIRNASAHARIDLNDERSTTIVETLASWWCFLILATASLPLLRDLLNMMTIPPLAAIHLAVSNPSPQLAPVTMKVFPFMTTFCSVKYLATSSAVELIFIVVTSCHDCFELW